MDWPDELDALIAAPSYHRLLFENDSVRVIENIVPRGHTVPLHTHCWPATLYLLNWSDIVRRDAEGTVMMDSRQLNRPVEGTVLWSPAIPAHTLENVGHCDFRLICIELKTPSAEPKNKLPVMPLG